MYDAGGLSGGTMEQPALKRLLKDIKTGKVRIVVVYKIPWGVDSGLQLVSSPWPS
jgi:hypothetical protein